MFNASEISTRASHQNATPFWQRILNEEALRDCPPLEKLLVGCQLIVALDGAELLAA
ncbi:MAG: hypothetical protein H0X40_14160 [Chthoniobacterales bacterium]|nr:hypothetical protein [Chthoniobacterales bacterium]